jgi:TRAP-type C4-dicarboxylate transport system substrate-binding protein
MKIFIWAGDAHGAAIWRSAGFQPVQLDPSEIIPMLETSVITALITPPFSALATQVYDKAPHMLDLNWAPLAGGLVIRTSVWDKLPAEAKPALLKSALEAGKANKIQGRAEGLKAVQAMKAKGLIVHPVTPALEDEWRRMAETIYPEIRGKIVAADTFDQVEHWLKEYRARNAAKP